MVSKVDAETGHEVSADDHGNGLEEGVPHSAPEEDKSEWLYRGPLPGVAGGIQRGVIVQAGAAEGNEPDGKEAFSKNRCKNSKDKRTDKDEKRSSSALEKHGGGVKDASSRECRWSELRRKHYAEGRKESGRRTDARR